MKLFSPFTSISPLALLASVLAIDNEIKSRTTINFGKNTGKELHYTLESGIKNICTKEEIDSHSMDPLKFHFFVFGDERSVKLKLGCQTQCKKVSDTKANFKFTDDDSKSFLTGNSSDVSRVWCDEVIERDSSIWSSDDKVPLPDSDKLLLPL